MKRVLFILVLAFVVIGCDLPTAYPEPSITQCWWTIETEHGEIVILDSPDAIFEWVNANPTTQYEIVEVICD